MRLIVVGAMMAIAMPAASGQYMKFGGVKGETSEGRCANAPKPKAGSWHTGGGGGAGKANLTAGGDGEAIQGALDRDIIRRIPKGQKPKPQEARSGVRVAAGDVTGDGKAAAARTKVGDITLKRGLAAEDCSTADGKQPPVKRVPTVRQ